MDTPGSAQPSTPASPSRRSWLVACSSLGALLLVASFLSLAGTPADVALPNGTSGTREIASTGAHPCNLEDRVSRTECLEDELERLVASGDRGVIVRGVADLDAARLDMDCSTVAAAVGERYTRTLLQDGNGEILELADLLNAEGCHTGLLFGMYEALIDLEPDLTSPVWSSVVTWCIANMAAFEENRTDCQTPLGTAAYRVTGEPLKAAGLCDRIVPSENTAIRTGCSFGAFVQHLQTLSLTEVGTFTDVCAFTESAPADIQNGCAQAAGMYLGNLVTDPDQLADTASISLSRVLRACDTIGPGRSECEERVLLGASFSLRFSRVTLPRFCESVPDRSRCLTTAARWLS